ncbi:MAG: DNA-binding protein [Deltaproteobacteria bacterium]|nr:MAG: DNA-binding protein [Deltaproteobacteria bacterium]
MIEELEARTSGLTVSEVAKHLSMTEKGVRSMLEARKLPYYKVGRLVRIDPKELLQWLRENRVSALKRSS